MDTPDFSKPHYLIDTFTRHPLASNLLMIMLVLAGLWGIRQLNVQLNPRQDDTNALVEITWPGASTEDVERLVTQPVEYQLRSLPGLSSLTSRTGDGYSRIALAFDRGTDMGDAIDRIKQRVAQARNLPGDIEPPVIRRDEYMETVAAILVTGPGELDELVPVAREIERDLLARGVDQVTFRGIPREEIAIQIDSQTLFELGVPLTDIAAKILNINSDVPAGRVGGGQIERRLRSLDQQRSSAGFEQLPMDPGVDGDLVRLGDIATVERRQQDDQRLLRYNDQPAIMIRLSRATGSDTLATADILYAWQADNGAALADKGIQATIWLEAWKFAVNQISLVLKNGLGGLLFVIATLLVFLNGRVGAWVTLGIPVAFLGALALFYSMGGTINFLSMVGIVMAIGIVVDDAIVVGEHALAQYEAGHSPRDAAARGAQHMFAPVMASSLTTLAAFLPLIVINSASIREIPVLMICIIFASIIECFLILPGHLRHSFERMARQQPGRFRQRFDSAFNRFRHQVYLPLLQTALGNRRAVLSLAFFAFVTAITLLASGRLKPELGINVNFEFAEAHLQFAAGTSAQQKQDWLTAAEEAAADTEAQLGGKLIVTHMINRNWATLDQQEKHGSQYAAIWVELVSPELRQVTLSEFTEAWRANLPQSAVVENLQFATGQGNRPDIQLYFSGAEVGILKAAAEDLAARLATYPGVSNVFDDLPYGKEQWVFGLTTEGRALGLTSEAIGRQLRAAFEGYRVQIFTENDAELEVRVSLPEAERSQLATIYQLPITTAAGEVLPLSSVANVVSRRGIDSVNHRNALKAVNVFASVDNRTNTAMAIIEDLEEDVIPGIVDAYGVRYGLGEGSAEEARAMQDLMLGAVIGLALIYLVLAWICASWSWPLAVMAAIPLGLTGALTGLAFMGMNLGAMAIMGVFTLTGVIVNDSIILIDAYRRLRSQGMPVDEALLASCGQRLRPVILTSLTTTLGLAPLMLENSPMGAVMIPLATVICFGLLYGTVLILFVIPSILSVLEQLGQRRPQGVYREIQPA